VKPKVVRIGEATPRGYRRDDLADPWTRYLSPPTGGSATSATSATPLISDVADVADVAHTPAEDTAPLWDDDDDLADDDPPDLDPDAGWEDPEPDEPEPEDPGEDDLPF
jgi:hypothetical protein